MTLLTPKAMEGYAGGLDYEAHIFVKSLYTASKAGTIPVNPANHCGRYALKFVFCLLFQNRLLNMSPPLSVIC